MAKERLAIIVATKDRHEDLRRLFNSILLQDTRPEQIIVVDGGDVPVLPVIEEFKDLAVSYVRKMPASLTAQRNAGIRMLSGDITLAAFLDDDIILEDGSLRRMVEFFESSSADVAAASFNNMGDRYKRANLAEKIFLVNADVPGRIMRSGFQSKLCSLDADTAVEWLVGCAMLYRRGIFAEFMFDEWFAGYARYEDVDFSYRVGKRYRMYVVAGAKVRHPNRPEDLSFSRKLGEMEVINRLYFVKKNKDLSVPLCYWALFGILLNNILKGVLLLNKRNRLRAAGNIAGLARSLTR
jgi:GT2 family glycosyltransferase